MRVITATNNISPTAHTIIGPYNCNLHVHGVYTASAFTCARGVSRVYIIVILPIYGGP